MFTLQHTANFTFFQWKVVLNYKTNKYLTAKYYNKLFYQQMYMQMKVSRSQSHHQLLSSAFSFSRPPDIKRRQGWIKISPALPISCQVKWLWLVVSTDKEADTNNCAHRSCAVGSVLTRLWRTSTDVRGTGGISKSRQTLTREVMYTIHTATQQKLRHCIKTIQ